MYRRFKYVPAGTVSQWVAEAPREEMVVWCQQKIAVTKAAAAAAAAEKNKRRRRNNCQLPSCSYRIGFAADTPMYGRRREEEYRIAEEQEFREPF